MVAKGDLAPILSDVIRFLKRLREVELPNTLENDRDNLLIRSEEALTTFRKIAQLTSSEPYLKMNAGLKGLSFASIESEQQEYVGCEEPQGQKQLDHYESFQNVETTSSIESREEKEPKTNDILIEHYWNFSVTKTKAESLKHGRLYKKEKKLFVFEQYCPCWAGLVNSHLLIYGSERDNRPSEVESIRGYTAVPTPNAIPRDPQKSQSAFKIFRDGSNTQLQFIAKTPKDMEQWVAKICEMCDENTDKNKINTEASGIFKETDVSQSNSHDKPPRCSEGEYQYVTSFVQEKTSIEGTPEHRGIPTFPKTTCINPSSKEDSVERTKPPPLPTRIPLRLPSLPTNERTLSFEQQDEEEDDIYQKIESFKDMHYQNLNYNSSSKQGDDSRNKRISMEKPGIKNCEDHKRQNSSTESETYDDVASAMAREKEILDEREQKTRMSHDNAEGSGSLGKLIKHQTPEKAEKAEDTVVRSPHKKSLLDRVRCKRESPRKMEKKVKRKTPQQPDANIECLPTYDDVFSVANEHHESKNVEDELPEYNCPPPPRSVFTKPPAINDAIEVLDFYDDVGAYRDKYKEEDVRNKTSQVNGGMMYVQNSGWHEREEKIAYENKGNHVPEDGEHYKVPRNDLCQPNYAQNDQQEDLYDDVAILVDFKARQRANLGKVETEEPKSSGNNEKKPWDRFVSGKRLRSNGSASLETSSRISNGTENSDDFTDGHSLTRMNTFQRLINKVENSLVKTVARPQIPATPPNKTNLTNDT